MNQPLILDIPVLDQECLRFGTRARNRHPSTRLLSPSGDRVQLETQFQRVPGVVAYFTESTTAGKSAPEFLFWVGFGLKFEDRISSSRTESGAIPTVCSRRESRKPNRNCKELQEHQDFVPKPLAKRSR